MTVPFDTDPLPNQSGAHQLVFNDPVLNSSSKARVVGISRPAGSLRTGEVPDDGAVVVVVDGGDVVVVVGGDVVEVVGGDVVVVVGRLAAADAVFSVLKP
jgi:hypothetical protein